MATITISRQTGSLGGEIARNLGEILGYRVIVRELINQAARRAGVPEAALAAIDELGILGVCPSEEACLAYRQAVETVMLELAEQGRVIIIGRGGQAILRGKPEVFHVRVIAPTENRIARLVQRYRISSQAACAQVEAIDHFRRNYLKKFYHLRWDDPELYDLVVNTARLNALDAARVIASAVTLKEMEKPEKAFQS
jgi:CMP/dCMP kinase